MQRHSAFLVVRSILVSVNVIVFFTVVPAHFKEEQKLRSSPGKRIVDLQSGYPLEISRVTRDKEEGIVQAGGCDHGIRNLYFGFPAEINGNIGNFIGERDHICVADKMKFLREVIM